MAAAKQRLEELAYLEDWTFVVSAYTAESMIPGRAQVVNKVEPEEQAPADDAATAPDTGAEVATPGAPQLPGP